MFVLRCPPPRVMRMCMLTFLACFPCSAIAQVVHDPAYTLSVELTGLANPQGVDVDAAGNVYLADSARGRILKGVNGMYAPVVSGIPVSYFFGLEIGPLAVHVASDQTLWYGEGGRETGEDQLHRHDLEGTLIQSLGATAYGGNWSGLAVDPSSGRLFASSANRDKLYTSDVTSGTYGPLVEFAGTEGDGLVSPTGLLLSDGTLYAGFYGPWGSEGQVATYDAATGELVNPALASGMPGVTAIDRLADGRLLVTQFGNSDGEGVLWTVNAQSGQKTMLVSQLTAATGVAVAPDGTTIYLVDMGVANESQGRLLRLTVVPSPAPAVLLALAGILRRRAAHR